MTRARDPLDSQSGSREGAISRHDDAEWNAVLGHELRSPIAAILGYYELVEEGTFGELPPPALDSIRRIGLAARQLLRLVEAVEHMGRDQVDVDDEIIEISAADLCRDAMREVAFDAESRATSLTLSPGDAMVRTRRVAACRALVLALGAAIKASPGATLTLEPGNSIAITGSRLDPIRDSGTSDVSLSGAALRLHLARATGRPAGVDIRLQDNGTVQVHFSD